MEDKVCYCLEFEDKNKFLKELRKMTVIAKQPKKIERERKNERDFVLFRPCVFVFFNCRAFQLILSVN